MIRKNRKNRKTLPRQHATPPAADRLHGDTSFRAFLTGLFVVTALVTPVMIALAPRSIAFGEVVLTASLIVGGLVILLASGCVLYERYGLKRQSVSWSGAFFTFAFPGSIIQVIGFAGTFRLFPLATAKHEPWPSIFAATLVLTFVYAFFTQLAFLVIKPTAIDKPARIVIIVAAWTAAFASKLGRPYLAHIPAAIVGITAALLMARICGRHVGRILLVPRSLWPYVRVMLVPTATFTVGYLMIASVFAGLMGTLYRFDDASFVGVGPDPSFFVFLYYTVTTMTAVGYGDITPASSLARLLSSAATFTALCWVTVVFAAMIAFLQPRFARILKAADGDS